METKTTEEKIWQLRLPRWKRESIIKFITVLGMAGTGIGMMLGGLFAWIIGEDILLFTGIIAGAIFICAGALGFLRCLDSSMSK